MKVSYTLCAIGLLLAQSAFATNDCSTRSLAGRWMFATDVGHQARFPGGGDITAIGTFHVDRQGNVSGRFDATVQDFGFLSGVGFTGTFVVNRDCTGTLTFVTSNGATRTDSIVVVDPWRIRGMSQDISNLWTYNAERL